MIRGNTRQFQAALVALVLAFAWPAANAATLNLQVAINGSTSGWYNGTNLGCVDGVGPTATCSGTNASWGGTWGMRMDSWNMYVDSDPVINGSFSVTNLSSSAQHFTLIFSVPISPAIPGGTLIGGSVQGGATDNNGNGVTLTTFTGTSLYTATIDGADVYSMYGDPQSFSAGSFLSLNVPNQAFGTPIPSLAGPAALSTIGIRYDFVLSGNDSATFSGVFVVMPQTAVPVPAAAWLLGSAVTALAWLRRRALA